MTLLHALPLPLALLFLLLFGCAGVSDCVEYREDPVLVFIQADSVRQYRHLIHIYVGPDEYIVEDPALTLIPMVNSESLK